MVFGTAAVLLAQVGGFFVGHALHRRRLKAATRQHRVDRLDLEWDRLAERLRGEGRC
jgi:hypothetical protein